MQKIIVSFSGGRTSAFMSHLLLQNFDRKDLCFVFANTGKERFETLDFIHQCDFHFKMDLTWLEAKVFHEERKGTSYKIVDHKTASRKGEPFAEVNKKYGTPNKNYPHCTRELKEAPIKKWAIETLGRNNYQMAIGIRADERRRVNRLRAEKKWLDLPFS